MEVAPFKFTQEYVDILGGEDSALFRNFRATLVDGFLLARDHCEEIMLVARMLCPGCLFITFNGHQLISNR